MVKAFLVPYTNTMCIMETGQLCVIPMKREINECKMIPALQLSKGVKKNEPTFLVTLKLDEEDKEVQAPEETSSKKGSHAR